MGERRGTTPTKPVVVKGADLTDMDVRLAFRCGRHLAVKEQGDIEMEAFTDEKGVTCTRVIATLTQEETLKWQAGQKVEVQVRAVDSAGYALATKDREVGKAKRILQDGFIEYRLEG